MNESVIRFGGDGFGILTPARGGADTPPVLVLFNAGLKPRSGPFRLYVELARSLAESGVTTVRCELPGVGDGGSHAPRWPEYHRDILHRVCDRTGCSSMVVGGVCSAADDAWRLAQLDERVDGLLMIDPYARGGPWLQWGRLLLLRRRSWARRWQALSRLWRRPEGLAPNDADLRNWPDAAAARRGMQALRRRRTRMLMLYTGGSASYFLHPRQFAGSWGCRPDGGELRFEHWPDADHLMMRPQDRRRLALLTRDWLLDAGGGAS